MGKHVSRHLGQSGTEEATPQMPLGTSRLPFFCTVMSLWKAPGQCYARRMQRKRSMVFMDCGLLYNRKEKTSVPYDS